MARRRRGVGVDTHHVTHEDAGQGNVRLDAVITEAQAAFFWLVGSVGTAPWQDVGRVGLLVLVVSDTNAAWTLLHGLNAAATLPKYGADHGYATVGALLSDSALRALNDDIQADYLDPIGRTVTMTLRKLF